MANAFSTVPAGYWEDGSTVTGTDLRRGNMFATTGGASGMATRGGLRPSRNALTVSLPGGMFARIQPGVGAVPTTSEGAYVMSVPAVVDLAVTAANGTNPRIDTVGLEVVPGSPTTWRVRMLDGTPAASPVAPTYAVSGGWFLPIADVRVNAGVSVPTSVTDRRAYTAAAGGVIPYPGLMALSKSARDTIAAGLPIGTVLFDDNVSSLQVVTTARSLMPVAQDPTLTTINWTSGLAAPGVTGTSYSPNYHGPDATFTAPRSGWAYFGYQADVQGNGNAGFGYLAIQVGGASIPDDQQSVPIGYFASSADRYNVVVRPRIPMWVVEGQAYSLSVQVRADLTGGWIVNGGAWAIEVIS
jgi:hypothetical protein